MTFWAELAALEFELGYVDAAGISTRSLRTGSGEAVVFLHGTSGHLEAFIRNIPSHSHHFACHAIDMVGHGYTAKPDYPLRIDRYVEHLLAYLDAEGLERAHLVGESLGGWVAARAAVDHPDRVGKITLAVPGGTMVDAGNMERIRASIHNAVADESGEGTRRRLEGLMFDPAASVSEELVSVRHTIYVQPDFRRSLDNILALQDARIRSEDRLTDEQLGQIKAPTLIVWGTHNPYGGAPEGERIHEQIPGSRLEIFEQCGHWPQHEHADRFNELNLAFLRGD